MDSMSSGDLADHRRLRAGHSESRIPIPPETSAAFGGTRADARTEIDALGIASEKSFGKHDERCASGLRLRAIVSEFLDRSRGIEDVGARLNHCGFDFVHASVSERQSRAFAASKTPSSAGACTASTTICATRSRW